MTAPILQIPVKVLRSAVSGRRPGDGNFRALTDGEMYLNLADGVLCWLDGTGTLRTTPLLDLITHAEVSAAISTAVSAAVAGVVGGAPAAIDTLKELADAIADDANFAATVTAALAFRSKVGQCRIACSSGTALTLLPGRSNQIWVNGGFRTIPAAGWTLSNTGLTAGTLYYTYVPPTGTALEASLTGHATDSTYGHEIKSDDPTRSYVGMVYMDGSSGTGTFADLPYKRYVATWFGRFARSVFSNNGQQPGTGSSNFVTLTGALNTAVVVHADELVDVDVVGFLSSSNTNCYADTQLIIDGVGVGSFTRTQAYGAGSNSPVSVRASTALSEGLHTLSVQGRSNGGTTSWNIQIAGAII